MPGVVRQVSELPVISDQDGQSDGLVAPAALPTSQSVFPATAFTSTVTVSPGARTTTMSTAFLFPSVRCARYRDDEERTSRRTQRQDWCQLPPCFTSISNSLFKASLAHRATEFPPRQRARCRCVHSCNDLRHIRAWISVQRPCSRTHRTRNCAFASVKRAELLVGGDEHFKAGGFCLVQEVAVFQFFFPPTGAGFRHRVAVNQVAGESAECRCQKEPASGGCRAAASVLWAAN